MKRRFLVKSAFEAVDESEAIKRTFKPAMHLWWDGQKDPIVFTVDGVKWRPVDPTTFEASI